MAKTHITDKNNSLPVEIRALSPEDIPGTLLENFIRFQETDRVWAVSNGELIEKEDHFIDDWDQQRLARESQYLRDCAARGGIVVGAFQDDTCIGFTSIQPDRFGSRMQYAEMTMCHVTRLLRGQGIGKKLFNFSCEVAKSRGIENLYLSTHPSIESQGFYRSVGCVLAQEINPEILAREPLDIHMEKHL